MTISDVSSAGWREMEREGRNHYHTRGSGGGAGAGAGQGGPGYNNGRAGGEPDLLLRWGQRKRLRCTKIQRGGRGDEAPPAMTPLPVATSSRADRHVVRPDGEHLAGAGAGAAQTRRRASPPSRYLASRSSEAAAGTMRSGGVQQINGGGASPEGGGAVTNGDLDNHQHGNGVARIGGGGERSPSSGGGGSDGAAAWPKFEITLTNKEKEEDFLVFKGSKLPLRPKKRTKIIQRTLNLVSPGAWLCDLTLERYEVREKKVCKKKPRGLRAMGDAESCDSEE